jgi:hypothetical protein
VTCPHLSATGVDQTYLSDSAKVWRCDGCGWTYRSRPVRWGADDPFPIFEAMPVVPCTTCDGKGNVRSIVDGEDLGADQCPACSSTGWVEP